MIYCFHLDLHGSKASRDVTLQKMEEARENSSSFNRSTLTTKKAMSGFSGRICGGFSLKYSE